MERPSLLDRYLMIPKAPRNFSISVLALIALVFATTFGGCTFDSAYLGSLQCSPEGAQRDGQICQGGYWVASATGELDATVDTGTDTVFVPDVEADTDTDICVPDDAPTLCAALTYDCGEVEVTDNCGTTRTISCGTCEHGEICHEDNRCACADQSVTELCAANDAQCGSLTAEDACGRTRTVECGGCEGAYQSCVENQCCQGESNAELCDLAPTIECGISFITDSCGVERAVDCGPCQGEGIWQDAGAPYACCSLDGEQTCQCQDQELHLPDCVDNACGTRVDETRTVRSGCSQCVALDCPDWGDCSYGSTCAQTGSKSRTCSQMACNQGACIVEGTVVESSSEDCNRNTNGTSCTTTQQCSTGVCQSGTCGAEPICSGTNTECGCNTCEDCTARNGNYPVSNWAPCCNDGQSCECRTVETRSYTCDGTACAYTVTGTTTERRGCSDCAVPDCENWQDCTYASDCARTGSRSRTCYAVTCSGTTCESTPYTDTQNNATACNRDTTGDTCAISTRDDGVCDSTGQCVVPSCEGTNTSCGEAGSCQDCTALTTTDWDGDPYACCDGTRLCTCHDQVTTTYTCQNNTCTAGTPTTQQILQPGSCNACPTGGSGGCFLNTDKDQYCCMAANGSWQNCD